MVSGSGDWRHLCVCTCRSQAAWLTPFHRSVPSPGLAEPEASPDETVMWCSGTMHALIPDTETRSSCAKDVFVYRLQLPWVVAAGLGQRPTPVLSPQEHVCPGLAHCSQETSSECTRDRQCGGEWERQEARSLSRRSTESRLCWVSDDGLWGPRDL